MEIYTIRKGVMREIPEDWTLKQIIKYTVAVVAGIIIGYWWVSAHAMGM